MQIIKSNTPVSVLIVSKQTLLMKILNSLYSFRYLSKMQATDWNKLPNFIPHQSKHRPKHLCHQWALESSETFSLPAYHSVGK